MAASVRRVIVLDQRELWPMGKGQETVTELEVSA